MKALSTKSRVSLGLVGLAVSALLAAAMLELVPDRAGAVREGRTAIAEVLASSSAGWLDGNDLRRAENTLHLAVERSSDILSAAMRRRDGHVVLRIGEHESAWQPMEGVHSTDSQLRVPILDGAQRWGDLELRFRPLVGEGVMALVGHPLVLLTGFFAMACFCAFYVYLSKTLTQLDPSKAVPGRVRSALDTMAEGLLVIDRGGRIVLANRAFATLVGCRADSLVGVEPTDLAFESVDDEGERSGRFPWVRALESGVEEYGVPMRIRDAAGVQRALIVNCSPVMGASGQVGGVLVSFDDVTELEARGEQLREAKEIADQANRSKSEFLANMSHEIRTPMNAILGFTEVLRRGYQRSDEESRSYLNTIHSSGTHLLDLINDILDLSKVESGRMEVERVPVQAHLVVHEVLQVLGAKAREKSVALGFDAATALPETVCTDPARLRQIVTNLVGNAIKFTEAGSVQVTARLDTDAREPMLELAVSDSGIGIPADKLGTVFEAFAQADSSVTRRFGGTGLGLPISRRFARALGGDITVASVPGEGSTFTVRLPTGPLAGVAMLEAGALEAAHTVDAARTELSWVFEPARVLVVDDARENRALLAVVLDGTGLELVEAGNGQEALDAVAGQHVDVVLMDMQMPVMDGYTATRCLRERGFDRPVIALTAHAMKGYEQECRAAGCDDFVTKPIDIDGLMRTLARWMPAREQAAASAADDARGTPALIAGSEADAITSSLAGDPRMGHVLQMFAERLDRRIEAMRDASARGDLGALAANAHWLKGSAGTVGFREFTEPARVLEEQAHAGDAAGAAVSVNVLSALAARVSVPGAGSRSADDPPPPPAPAADVALVSTLAGDARMHGVIRMFHERLAQHLDEVSADGDLEALAQCAHWLKGSAGTVGYGALTEMAAALESRARAGDVDGAADALERVREMAARIELPAAAPGVA